MDKPKTLTDFQAGIVAAHGMDPADWMLCKDYNKALYLANKRTGRHRWINKSAPKKPDRARGHR